jgi:hypothetical protein
MALFNTNQPPQPFTPTGWNNSQTPSPDIGAQFFLGCTVIGFSVSADWSSQGGSLTVNILEDTRDESKLSFNSALGTWYLDSGGITQKLIDLSIYDWNSSSYGSLPVIGSPQRFRVLNNDGDIVFQYDGIIEGITRTASPSEGKVFSVVLASPLKLLNNCSIILSDFPGFGHAKEGCPSGISTNGYYKLSSIPSSYSPTYYGSTETLDVDLDSSLVSVSPSIKLHEVFDDSRPSRINVDSSIEDVGITFGSNNRSLNWSNVYNIQNIFGVFESNSHGLPGYAKFGGARTGGGMRLDMIAYAVDELINRNPDGDNTRRFGGNIVSGTTTYNFYQVATSGTNSNPYFYGFDIYSFYNAVVGKLGADYIYPGDVSSSLIDFISTACDDAGLDFVIELSTCQSSDAGEANYWNGSSVLNFDSPGSLYHNGSFPLQKSYTNSTLGGVITVKVLDRRTLSLSNPANVTNPFSKIAYSILGYELPDNGDWSTRRINPGASGNSYLDPLDDDYSLKGTDGSSPDGGSFPVVYNTSPLYDADFNASNTTIALRDSQEVTAKFVTGGFQSRIVKVPEDRIYQYWGSIDTSVLGTGVIDPFSTQTRLIPVITPILEHNDVIDFIMIDAHNIVPTGSNEWYDNIFTSGIYMASVAEIRSAMKSYTSWKDFIHQFKPCMEYSLFRADGIDTEQSANFVIESQKLGISVEESGTTTTIDVSSDVNTLAKANFDHGSEEPEAPKKTPVYENNSTVPGTGIYLYHMLKELHKKVADIGETHYGKTWAVLSPQVSVKLDENEENFGGFIRSWVPDNSAYLEPSVFDSFHAPLHNSFLKSGRLEGFANYEASISGDMIIRGEAFKTSFDGELKFSFEQTDDLVKSNYSDTSLVSTHITSKEDYTYAPYDYFYYYDRGRRPLIKNGSVYSVSYSGNNEITHPLITINDAYSIYDNTAKSTQDASVSSINNYSVAYGSISGTLSAGDRTDLNRALCNDKDTSDFTNTSNLHMIEDFLGLIVPDHGLNCFTFTVVETPRVFYPTPDTENYEKFISFTADQLITSISNAIEKPTKTDVLSESQSDNGQGYFDTLYYPRCVSPKEIGLPQKSTRHVYGPWFTDHNFIYGGKVDFIKDESLVPENFIFPIYGTLSSAGSGAPNFSEQLSGFAGLNLAGQSLANSLDGYGKFAIEEGSVTFPGAPAIKRIGDGLFDGGPYVTELNVNVGAQGIQTTYSFNSAVKKAGRTNKDIITKLRNISKSITR